MKDKSVAAFYNNSLCFIFCVPDTWKEKNKKNFIADAPVSGRFKEFTVLISFSPDVIIRPII